MFIDKKQEAGHKLRKLCFQKKTLEANSFYTTTAGH